MLLQPTNHGFMGMTQSSQWKSLGSSRPEKISSILGIKNQSGILYKYPWVFVRKCAEEKACTLVRQEYDSQSG